MLHRSRLFLLQSLFFFCQCTSGPSEAECVLLLDRYTEMVIDQSRIEPSERQRERLKKEARDKAYNDPEFWRCSHAISRGDYQCAMKAHNADEMERCLL